MMVKISVTISLKGPLAYWPGGKGVPEVTFMMALRTDKKRVEMRIKTLPFHQLQQSDRN